MSDAKLVKTRLRAGVWEGVLSGVSGQPLLEVMHLEAPVAGTSVVEIAGRPGSFAVRVPVPVEALSEGVQTFLIRDAVLGNKLGHL